MKLILKENVPELGYKDEIVEVKDGYGRNYLIPQGKAIIASKANVKQLEENNRQRAHKIAEILKAAQDQAQALEGTKLTISAKTSANGTVFGSVNAAHIAEALKALGHEIDRKIIYIKNPVKEVGSYQATVKLHREVEVDIDFDVVPEVEEEA